MIPRPEHPRPQFVRENWLNLNGTWTYEFDFARSGAHKGRELYKSQGFASEITVPFCPESPLSGVGHHDFIEGMWYHRKLLVPGDWQGKRVILHFGAVDYECEAYLNGVSLGTHLGGSSSFEFDITDKAAFGEEMDLVVRVEDVMRGTEHPYGKQCFIYGSHGCSYTRTTGIWQTVWLEAVGTCGFKECFLRPDIDAGGLYLTPDFYAFEEGMKWRARVLQEGRVVASGEWPVVADAASPEDVARAAESMWREVEATAVETARDRTEFLKFQDGLRLWCPEDPFLYDVELEVLVGETVVDRVASYAGMRKYHCANGGIFLNNKPIFMRMVLDQGFYPDGIWTAPSDAALKQDIELSMAAGFNGARLHQKVFEERFHYWADRLGYLTWGEFPSWGCDPNKAAGYDNHRREWAEVVRRDRSHPSIVAWTPWNETWDVSDPVQHERTHVESYRQCTQLDPSRPVNTSSGGMHYVTDLWTVHMYQTPDQLATLLPVRKDGSYFRNFPVVQLTRQHGQPFVVDEIGGIRFIPEGRKPFAENSWGYRGTPETEEAFLERLRGTVKAFLSYPHIKGFCYTQLTDVEQEQNGIYNYDRTDKVAREKIREIFTQPREWGEN